MTDTELLDAIAARYDQAVDEQDVLFQRRISDYTVDNEDLLGRFMDDVRQLLDQRESTRTVR